jgi:glycerol-3-phosphate dehydrogenase
VIDRTSALETIAGEEFDVVVVGGGVTGAGVALDAAARGFTVALVEREDYAAGTSSRSSKLVHGGLRYLRQFELGLVREALLERALMVKLAPHLVRPLPLVVAAFDGKRPDRLIGVGLNMYDVMAWHRGRRSKGEDEWSPERHRTIGGDEVSELLPALASRRPSGGYLFYDCQTDDARLVLTILGEAERYGAVCANRAEARTVLRRSGRAVGVRVVDVESGGEFDVRARHVVNATGVWADRLPADELRDLPGAPRIRPSRGTHVLVARERLPVVAGAIVPAGDGRSIFVLPWLGRTLIGTTDRDYTGALDHVPPADEDIAYLLDAVNAFFGSDLSPDDLVGAFAGVRPLVGGDDRSSVDISRRAELFESPSGVVTITGGKLTTWRRMAAAVVDRLVEREGRRAPCRTDEIPLGMPIDPRLLPDVEGVSGESKSHLAARYGHAAREVLALAASDRELAAPIVAGAPDLLAEVAWAARREQARSLADVFLRRTRLGLTHASGVAADSVSARRAATVFARELGRDTIALERELQGWQEVASAEGLANWRAAPGTSNSRTSPAGVRT